MNLIDLPEYIQWIILKYLEDPGFNINWRQLIMSCRYYRDLVKNTPHLSKKICPKILDKCIDIIGNPSISIQFDRGIIIRYSMKLNPIGSLNPDRRTWGDLHEFWCKNRYLFNKVCQCEWYQDEYKNLCKFNKFSSILLIQSPYHYYPLRMHIADFTDEWMMILICTQSNKVIYCTAYQTVYYHDPIELIRETPVKERWDLLINKLGLEIIDCQ